VTLDKPLEYDVPVDSTRTAPPPSTATVYASKVSPLVDPVVGVGFENLSFTQDMPSLNRLDAVHNYGNMAGRRDARHRLQVGRRLVVRGVHTEMTGSHPIVTEEAYTCRSWTRAGRRWNKGKGGNGYFRGSRVWDSLLRRQHLPQTCAISRSSGPRPQRGDRQRLRLGPQPARRWERNNLFELNTVTVPYEHRSANCRANCARRAAAPTPTARRGSRSGGRRGKKAVKWSARPAAQRLPSTTR